MNVNEIEPLGKADADVVTNALNEILEEFQMVMMFEFNPSSKLLKDKNSSYLKWLSGEYKALKQAFLEKLAEKVIFVQQRQEEDRNETEKESNDCDTGPILGTGTCEED